jgi:cold shock CspA family protein
MKGTIKTYLPEKKYGFIKGDDGKDYFFHLSEFKVKDDVSRVCEEAVVDFDQQATPKGYRARSCKLVDPSDVFTYVTPDECIASKSSGVRGWEVMERGDWIVHGSSSDSPEAAKKNLIQRAETIGANGLIDVEYYKTTGSEPGTGKGTYYFTIHNFRGRPVILARRNSQGNLTADELTGVNQKAEVLKKQLRKETEASEMKKYLVWAAVAIGSLVALGTTPFFIIGLVILGVILGRSTDYDSWLEKV